MLPDALDVAWYLAGRDLMKLSTLSLGGEFARILGTQRTKRDRQNTLIPAYVSKWERELINQSLNNTIDI